MIKKSVLVVLILFSLFLGCQHVEAPEKPDSLIQEEKMVDILYDVSILKSLKTYSYNEMRSLDLKPESFVYDKYGIDSLQLAQNLSYYAVDFNKYIQVWQKVNDRITAKLEEIEQQQIQADSLRLKKNKTRRDSIKETSQKRTGIESIREVSQDSILAPVSN